MMDKDGFLRALLSSYYEHDCQDIDGGDIHELLIDHGLTAEKPISTAQAKEDWALLAGLKPGDIASMPTDEMKALVWPKDPS